MNRFWSTNERIIWEQAGGFADATSHTANTSPAFRFHRDSALWIDWDGDSGPNAEIRLQFLRPGIAMSGASAASASDWAFVREQDDGASSFYTLGLLPGTSSTQIYYHIGLYSSAPGTRSGPSTIMCGGIARLHLNYVADPGSYTPTIQVYYIVPNNLNET